MWLPLQLNSPTLKVTAWVRLLVVLLATIKWRKTREQWWPVINDTKSFENCDVWMWKLWINWHRLSKERWQRHHKYTLTRCLNSEFCRLIMLHRHSHSYRICYCFGMNLLWELAWMLFILYIIYDGSEVFSEKPNFNWTMLEPNLTVTWRPSCSHRSSGNQSVMHRLTYKNWFTFLFCIGEQTSCVKQFEMNASKITPLWMNKII